LVLRTDRRAADQGNQFWGCSTSPKCRGVFALKSSEENAIGTGDRSGTASGRSDVSEVAVPGVDSKPPTPNATPGGNDRRRSRDNLAGVASSAFRTYDKTRRLMLEAEESEASGHWSAKHR